MTKPCIKIILFFSLFLILFSLRGYAIEYSVSSTYPGNDTVYDPSAVYYFNITWNNTIPDENLIAVNFTLVLPNGSTTVYDLTTSPIRVFNNSSTLPAETWINFTQDQLGSAGSYYYNWSAYNGINWNTTFPSTMYYIQKATSMISLFLDGNESNGTYNLNHQNANFIALLNIPEKNITLTSNLTDVGFLNNVTNITKIINLTIPGLFYLNASFDGDQNYSANYTTRFFEVVPYWVDNKTSPISSSIYYQGNNYSFQIKLIGDIKNISFESNFFGSLALYNNTTSINITHNIDGIYWINFTDLFPGSYSYRWNVTDIYDNLISTNFIDYIVRPIPVALTLTTEPSGYSWNSFPAMSSVKIICTADVSNSNVSLTVGSTINNTNYSASIIISPLSAGNSFIISCSIPANTNYSADPLSQILLSPAQQTTTTTTTTTSSSSTGSFTITGLTSSLIVNTGESKSTTFNLSNTLDAGTLVNVTISITGIDSSWYLLSQTKVPYLYRNKPQILTITFNIPTNAEAKNYDITMTAKGTVGGSTTTKNSTPKSMRLTVNASQPVQPLLTPTPETQETVENNTQENITSNETVVGPTGLAATFEYLKNNLVIIVAIAACLLIFMFRNNITTTLMKTSGRKITEKPEKTRKTKTVKIKLPSLKNYKLIVGLKKGKTKALEKPVTEEIKRPAILEREIKRDIKELQHVLETEKKIEKKNKKVDVSENN